MKSCLCWLRMPLRFAEFASQCKEGAAAAGQDFAQFARASASETVVRGDRSVFAGSRQKQGLVVCDLSKQIKQPASSLSRWLSWLGWLGWFRRNITLLRKSDFVARAG